MIRQYWPLIAFGFLFIALLADMAHEEWPGSQRLQISGGSGAPSRPH